MDALPGVKQPSGMRRSRPGRPALDRARLPAFHGPKANWRDRRERAMTVTMYHNPRCSKSRQTLKLLQEKGVEPEIVEYLKTPPDAKTLKSILKKLGMEPRALMRKKEAPYKELNLADPGLGEDTLVDSMVANDQPDLSGPTIMRDFGGLDHSVASIGA
jgi:arsenate reductase